ncbi:hypothetical protein C4569_01270 [Candidatus Parcubacteria bacterium]|nr:MAG: hypothetical protein C4569_01270 [Candidatus Parcubacteria bacterium]
MPRYNGTGPMGQGPGTGWGMGPCYIRQGVRNRTGFGFKRVIGNLRQPSQAEEKENAKAYIEDLKAEIEETQKYLKGLGSEN